MLILDEVIRMQSEMGAFLIHKLGDAIYKARRTHKERHPLMQILRNNIQNAIESICGPAARLFGQHGHGVTFVEQAELSLGICEKTIR